MTCRICGRAIFRLIRWREGFIAAICPTDCRPRERTP